MSLTVSILPEPADMEAFSTYLHNVGKKLARAELVPLMIAALEPVVEMEKGILADHSISGALAGSLQARSGSGDRPDTISVFSAPTATRKNLIAAWSRGRKQHRGWAMHLASLGKGGRKAVFYGPFVEAGHRIVNRDADGNLAAPGGRTAAVHFAAGAMEAIGDKQAEAAADAVLTAIFGG